MQLLLAAIAVIIILGLAFYAGTLISQIKMHTTKNKQQQQQDEQAISNKQQRNDNICTSIRCIAQATTQQQCNFSEAAIRLTVLLETLQLDTPINIETKYPALTELFNNVKEMPTHQQRKKVAIGELKKLDKQRLQFEKQLESKIILETKQLANFTL